MPGKGRGKGRAKGGGRRKAGSASGAKSRRLKEKAKDNPNDAKDDAKVNNDDDALTKEQSKEMFASAGICLARPWFHLILYGFKLVENRSHSLIGKDFDYEDVPIPIICKKSQSLESVLAVWPKVGGDLMETDEFKNCTAEEYWRKSKYHEKGCLYFVEFSRKPDPYVEPEVYEKYKDYPEKTTYHWYVRRIHQLKFTVYGIRGNQTYGYIKSREQMNKLFEALPVKFALNFTSCLCIKFFNMCHYI